MSDLAQILDVALRKIEAHLMVRPAIASDATLAPTLRDLHERLTALAADMDEVRLDTPRPDDLSLSLQALADEMAAWRTGVYLAPEAIHSIVGLLNEATAHAWALEMALRLATGGTRDIDRPTLALAAKLARQGVRVGPAADTRGGVA